MTTPQTYSESRGLPRFDWRAWLERARDGKTDFSEEFQITQHFNQWDRCPVAQLSVDLPREPNGQPEDWSLYRLSCEFNSYLRDERWGLALLTLGRIEARSAELIAQIGKEGAS